MPRVAPKPIPMGLLVSCLRHMKAGQVRRTDGNIWVRKVGTKQIRCDKEAREVVSRGWATEITRLTEQGRVATLGYPTPEGQQVVDAWLSTRVPIVESSIVE